MPMRKVHLTDRYDRFVAEQIASGRFKNASAVVRAGLQLLEQVHGQEEEKLILLRSSAAMGFGELDQGQGTAVEDEGDLRRFIGKIGRRATRKTRRPASRG